MLNLASRGDRGGDRALHKDLSFSPISYWQIFRINLVLLFLFLLADAFYRWDGFRYYASFSEFLPSFALVTCTWTVVTVVTTMLAWLPLRGFEWFCQRMSWKFRLEHILIFICVFVLLGTIVWLGKKITWFYIVNTTFVITSQMRQILFFGMTLTAVFITWMFRKKSARWIGEIQERITPLIWIAGIWIVISVALVSIYTLIKGPSYSPSRTITNSSSIKDDSRPNIILVTFDALTALDMSAYGYQRPTTPFITKWSKNASLFTKLQAESNFTTPTVASLFTGKRVWTHQTYHAAGSKPIKSSAENLALLLKKNGYYNIAYNENHQYASTERLGIYEDFNVNHTIFFQSKNDLYNPRKIFEKVLYQLFAGKIRFFDWTLQLDFIPGQILEYAISPIARKLLPKIKLHEKNVTFYKGATFDRFLSTLDKNPPEPFFGWIHLFPPHSPYLPPYPYLGAFDSSLKFRHVRDQKNLSYKDGPYRDQANKIMRARYDEFIRFCDKQFEDFINRLRNRNKLENTVILLSSDHGESFEHNYYTHKGPHLYEQVTHIPLIIKEPNQTKGIIINDIVEQIDIPATILDLATIPVPSWMEGRSLVPLMRGKKHQLRPAFSMTMERNPSRRSQITKGTIAVWVGDYKLIYYLEDEKSLLFNLKKDPGEMSNLFEVEPEVGQRLLSLIQLNLKKANEKIIKGK